MRRCARSGGSSGGWPSGIASVRAASYRARKTICDRHDARCHVDDNELPRKSRGSVAKDERRRATSYFWARSLSIRHASMAARRASALSLRKKAVKNGAPFAVSTERIDGVSFFPLMKRTENDSPALIDRVAVISKTSGSLVCRTCPAWISTLHVQGGRYEHSAFAVCSSDVRKDWISHRSSAVRQ